MASHNVFSVSCSRSRSRSHGGSSESEVFVISDMGSDGDGDKLEVVDSSNEEGRSRTTTVIKEPVGARGFARLCAKRLQATPSTSTFAQGYRARGYRLRIGTLRSGSDVGVIAADAVCSA